MNRWKQVIDDELRAHTDERRVTEVEVAVHALNRMLEVGTPKLRPRRPIPEVCRVGAAAPLIHVQRSLRNDNIRCHIREEEIVGDDSKQNTFSLSLIIPWLLTLLTVGIGIW